MGTVAVERPLLKDVVKEKIGAYKREWEERYSSLLVGRAHWKYTAWAELAIIAGLSAALWNVARTSHTELYVLERSGREVAYAGPVKPVSMDDAAWDEVRVEALKKFITAWRTVTTDAAAQNLNWDTAFAFVGEGTPAYAALSKWFDENDPSKRAAKGEVVTVQYKTHDKPVGGSSTYGIWWTETKYTSNGQVVASKTWRARIVYVQKPLHEEFARSVNGLGILATELTFEPVEEGTK
jgi:type IV secretory pathway TrbF-like protein